MPPGRPEKASDCVMSFVWRWVLIGCLLWIGVELRTINNNFEDASVNRNDSISLIIGRAVDSLERLIDDLNQRFDNTESTR